ncbi:GspE/PulE family protein [Allosphingosinicella vermicomposti]|uniref:GspE/PulE family protein n=1 Tax=Allosphingosinicella vermicomposti TaxID=614671 RepID=UPI00131A5D14|nr:GspE/PulE family protein [Allosphingosinicella vermicomposti]
MATLLVDKGLVSASDVTRAQEISAQTRSRMSSVLVKLGLVSESDLLSIQQDLTGLQVVKRAEYPDTLPEADGLMHAFLARHAVIPLTLENRTLTLAMADPHDEIAAQAVAFAYGAEEVVRTLTTFSDVEDALGTDNVEFDVEGGASAGAAADLERLIEGESDAPIIRLVQRLITNAVNRRASDIHIEPMARHLCVRYRIDGRLSEVERHPDNIAAPIASRIKVMAGLDIAETRLPQDGRLRMAVRGQDVDVRVATSPIAHGESIVLRILGRTEVPLDLDRLGLPAVALAKLGRALERPHGIILVTGPTGSGKSTTLYAAINRLKRPDVKILTVEDPVEVILEGVNQVQVKPEIDLSYAATLRAFLRQDPDILMIGEIRDHETAEIAMRAALTGHLVLSTLHTNSAIGAFTRLKDIGVEPYLTASTVIAAIAQRLIRSLCEECRVARALKANETLLFEKTGIEAPALVYEPAGCISCAHSGYRGRLPLMEIVEVDEPLRDHIRSGHTEALAASSDAESLLGHGLSLVAKGRTSLAEVERAVQLG